MTVLAQLFASNCEDLSRRHILHTLRGKKATVRRVFCLVARTAPDITPQYRRMVADRTRERGIGWSVDSDQRCFYRARHVHRPTITR